METKVVTKIARDGGLEWCRTYSTNGKRYWRVKLYSTFNVKAGLDHPTMKKIMKGVRKVYPKATFVWSGHSFSVFLSKEI